MALMYSYSAAAAAAALLNPRVIKEKSNKSDSTNFFTITRTRASRRKVVIVMSTADNHFSVNTKLQIILPSTNKVFEDPSKGIVCYTDENGEITCEGIDEGPRFSCHPCSSSIFASSNHNYREAEITDLLRRCSIQMIEDSRFIN